MGPVGGAEGKGKRVPRRQGGGCREVGCGVFVGGLVEEKLVCYNPDACSSLVEQEGSACGAPGGVTALLSGHVTSQLIPSVTGL